MLKICLFCKHFYYWPEIATMSAVTPGDPPELGCDKDRWSSDTMSDSSDVREAMLQADLCPYYELSDDTKEIINGTSN